MPIGLDEAEVRARVARGDVNHISQPPTRTFAEILRANIFTRFNAILGVLLAVIIVVGPFQDGLFGVVLVANSAIGILQELRAKRTVERLSVLSAPMVRVVRCDVVAEVTPGEVVLDDVIELHAGDQVAVDGLVLDGDLELDESLVSGEAEAVARSEGAEVLSGSFVAAGSGRYRATRVGRNSFASSLVEEGRKFTLVRSELREGINRILRFVTWVMLPTAALLVSSQLRTTDLHDALRGSVAGVGSMVPEGLVLLTTVAYAVAVLRLGRRRVLVQELAAVEGLARVDVLCLDKTGTLTEGGVVVDDVVTLDERHPIGEALGALAATDPSPNNSLLAIASAHPPPQGWVADERVAFSSARKWAATTFEGRGSYVLGAPEVLLTQSDSGDEHGASATARARAEDLAGKGLRVLLLAHSDAVAAGGDLPVGLAPVALVVLSERLRPHAAEILAFFGAQGVAIKVISGDSPSTVGAIAVQVGVVGGEDPVDARQLGSDAARLREVMSTHSVFGRVTPHQKVAMVAALQADGHVVAMTGDGVNDVLALKQADIGVAMGSGTDAARAVAQVVLLDDAFDVLPSVVAEGRRVIANVERVANLFVTKTFFAMVLSLAVVAAKLPFPFLPRQLTIVSTLAIGLPAFFLSLAKKAPRARPGFVRRVLRFAVPAGVVAALSSLAIYAIARDQSQSQAQARTAATMVLFAVSLWIVVMLARPLNRWRQILVAVMAGSFVVDLAVPGLRRFYALDLPSPLVCIAAAAVAAGAAATLDIGWQALLRVRRWRHDRRHDGTAGGPPSNSFNPR